MRLAWAISLAAQAALVLALMRRGEYTLWLWFLAAGLVRSAILWPFDGMAYFWIWVATEPVMLVLQIAAVLEATQGVPREWPSVGLWAAIAAFTASVYLTSGEWPTARRGALLLRQAGAFGCAGWLGGAALDGHRRGWLLAYFAIHCATTAAAQTGLTRAWVSSISTVHLFAISALFCLWSIKHFQGETSRYER